MHISLTCVQQVLPPNLLHYFAYYYSDHLRHFFVISGTLEKGALLKGICSVQFDKFFKVLLVFIVLLCKPALIAVYARFHAIKQIFRFMM